MQTVLVNIKGKKALHCPSSNTDVIDNIQIANTNKQANGMDKIVVNGGKALNGIIPISGAKNAALSLVCCTLLTKSPVNFTKMPTSLRDTQSMTDLLEHLGCTVDMAENTATICAKNITSTRAPYDLVRKMRASIWVLGPLLARFGHAEVSLPGGCAIGARPVDLHIKAMEALGANIEMAKGYIYAKTLTGRLIGANYTFPKISVGATQNTIMAASLAKGTTILKNCAQEPEIVDLANCLNAMGANITGQGTSTITIEGVEKLNGCTHEVLADRIETGTYAIAVAMTGGKLRLTDTSIDLIMPLVDKLQDCGVHIEQDGKDIIVERNGANIKGMDITTEAWPGFPTDLQAQFMAMLTICQGRGHVTETIFENRFMHVPELIRMGANIKIDGNMATITGTKQLTGAEVMATDLRASVSLILAALVAKGETTINRIYHLDRGYEHLVEKLFACGADIKRITETENK